jgi:hypothetical protein
MSRLKGYSGAYSAMQAAKADLPAFSQIEQGYSACYFLFQVGQFTEDEQRSIISLAGIPRGSMHGLKSNPTSIPLILLKLWHD